MSIQTTELQWQCAALESLTAIQLYDIFAARSEVFVVEQNCVFLDMDGVDKISLHLVGWGKRDEKNAVAAYLRIVPPGVTFPEVSLGRVITSKDFRGSGAGKELITQGLAHLEKYYPQQPVRIGAQAYLEKFYGSFGFVTVSDVYLEDDIPHVEMLRPASTM
ncbi:GNAT family N-acetyltransferase [Undibacterium sp. Jales W-56]|uniref:GNAT family N-acetyltransferase n=1 Tax=Undibacterium sp. Jales W-56 TaxID=2897325 RepID=UPI0021D35052|nr:GNAT family N-acetyltransferase [Undibacterium sp. Jales W-56]MCU6435605.1 GNAT family N-acetyltransferase [Undibacterium sp. Jales W-56]